MQLTLQQTSRRVSKNIRKIAFSQKTIFSPTRSCRVWQENYCIMERGNSRHFVPMCSWVERCEATPFGWRRIQKLVAKYKCDYCFLPTLPDCFCFCAFFLFLLLFLLYGHLNILWCNCVYATLLLHCWPLLMMTVVVAPNTVPWLQMELAVAIPLFWLHKHKHTHAHAHTHTLLRVTYNYLRLL